MAELKPYQIYAVKYGDPDDQVHVWYSRAGLLVFRARLVGDATDEHGNVLGKMYSQDKYTLQDLSLVGRGPRP